MANPTAITVHALGAEGESGVGSAVDLGAIATGSTVYRSAARLRLELLSGDSVLVTIETSPDGETGWRVAGGFEGLSGHGVAERAFVGLSRYVRARWELAGEATFSLAGDAHQVFLSRDDVTSGEIPAHALTDVPDHIFADAIIKASDEVEDALNSAYRPPILAVGDSVRKRAAAIAIFSVLKWRGFQPEGPDELIREAARDAEKWLYRVSQGQIKPPGIVDTTPHQFEGGSVVASRTRRGW